MGAWKICTTSSTAVSETASRSIRCAPNRYVNEQARTKMLHRIGSLSRAAAGDFYFWLSVHRLASGETDDGDHHHRLEREDDGPEDRNGRIAKRKSEPTAAGKDRTTTAAASSSTGEARTGQT